MKFHETYKELLSTLKRLDRLESIGALLGWDEQVNLPPHSGTLRGEQRAVYTEIHHREATDPRIAELLATLESDVDSLDPDQAAVLRGARRSYNRLIKIPAEFAARRAKAETASFHAWVEARKDDNFEKFLPHLEEQLQFAKDEAAFLGAENPYNYWVDQFDPGMTREIIEPLFDELLPELKEIVGTITSSPKQPDTSAFKGFPIQDQEAFLRKVVRSMGFNFNKGRIDVAIHPFCGGHPQDTRMTTRFSEDNPLDSLSSSMHETGHALYEQGLNDEFAGTDLGVAVGMAVHESQSRMWENQVGRSRSFWNHWEQPYRDTFPEQLKNLSSDGLYHAINNVALTPIRVDADEVTYNLHIMVRFALEKKLFDGSLDMKDLPDAWNETSMEILGYRPKNNREGCLQDVHWSGGMFGYFPSYCLGNLLAAQLWYRLREDLTNLDSDIEKGEFRPLLDWLRKHVHCKGRRLYTLEFTKDVTGMELSPKFLVRYLRERYLPLYTDS